MQCAQRILWHIMHVTDNWGILLYKGHILIKGKQPQFVTAYVRTHAKGQVSLCTFIWVSLFCVMHPIYFFIVHYVFG